MLHTVFYDMRNALLSVGVVVWWVRAVRSSSRWRDRRTMLVKTNPIERGGGDMCANRLRPRGTRADGTAQRSALISLIVAVLQLERSSFIQSSASLSSPVSQPPVVMWSWCSTSSSVTRRQYYGDPRKVTCPTPSSY